MIFATAVSPMNPSDQWLFDKLDSMRNETTEQHQRLRSDVNSGFDLLRKELQGHNDELRAVKDRVLTMEIQRGEEQKQTSRRQWGISLAVTVVMAVINWLFGWYGKR
jgi:Flp pilus assembly protein TadB